MRRILVCLIAVCLLLCFLPAMTFAASQENVTSVSKSKEASELDADFNSQITLSLPSAEEQLVTDVVFVLDKSTSTIVEDEALQMLKNLEQQASDTGARIKAGVVIFNKSAHEAIGLTELSEQNLAKIEASDIHARLGLEKGKYILLSAHREENIDTEKNFTSLFTAINKMAEKYDMPILYSCHPRSRKRLEQSGFQLDKRVIQHEPLGFHDYNCLQMNAFCVVSDSGTLPEESSFFTSVGHPFPAVCIRTSTERPEALDKGDFILAGIDGDHLLQAVDVAVEMNKNCDLGIPVPDYVDENVSDKVVKIIQSYTGVVNKMVWRK